MVIHYPATSEMKSGEDLKERAFGFPSLLNCSIREVHIENRFPVYGYAKNNICNLAIRVMKAHRVTLFVYGEEITIPFKKGESFEIPKNIPYYLIAEPSAVLYIVSEPIWDEAQSKIVTF